MTYDELEKFIESIKFSPKHPAYESIKKELSEALAFDVDYETLNRFLLGLDIGFKKDNDKE